MTVSTSEFHSPQSGHLPIHFGWALPQFEQTYRVFDLAMVRVLSRS